MLVQVYSSVGIVPSSSLSMAAVETERGIIVEGQEIMRVDIVRPLAHQELARLDQHAYSGAWEDFASHASSRAVWQSTHQKVNEKKVVWPSRVCHNKNFRLSDN